MAAKVAAGLEVASWVAHQDQLPRPQTGGGVARIRSRVPTLTDSVGIRTGKARSRTLTQFSRARWHWPSD
jgi:hypothetical protein